MKELNVNIVLKNDLHFKEVGAFLGKLISTLLVDGQKLKKIHLENKNHSKKYSFSHFYQKENDGIYKKGNCYKFVIRTWDISLMNFFQTYLKTYKSDYYYYINSELVNFNCNASNLYKSSNPVVLTRKLSDQKKEKYFANDINLNEYKNQLQNSILKVYRFKNNISEILNHNFIKEITILTERPIPLKYKNNTFLSHKLLIEFNEDPFSQELKELTIQVGLGEKTTSIGTGFLEIFKEVEK